MSKIVLLFLSVCLCNQVMVCMDMNTSDTEKLKFNIGKLKIGIDKTLLKISIGIAGLVVPSLLKESQILKNNENAKIICSGVQFASVLFLISIAWPSLSKEFFVQ